MDAREINRRIATLLGWDDFWSDGGPWFGMDPGHTYYEDERMPVPDYATDLSSAWLAAEHLRQTGWLVVLKAIPPGEALLAGSDWTWDPQIKELFVCEVTRLPWASDRDAHPAGQRAFWAYTASPAEAICRAVLKTVIADPAEVARRLREGG